jgi:sugar O-acyltransferase (sialic acid O-acetyltransferase NeuD family)
MKRLVIVGASSLGHEVYSWALDVNRIEQQWHSFAFLDDDANALDSHQIYKSKVPLVGSIQRYIPNPDDVLVMAISDPRLKIDIANDLTRRGAAFTSLVHPSVILAENVQLGTGCVLCPHVVVSCDARIEEFVSINLASTIGHDVHVRTGSTISSHVDLMGFVNLGVGVFVGSHAAVLPNITVGDFAVLGAGSVVLRNVRTSTTVMGVPAKQIAGFSNKP